MILLKTNEICYKLVFELYELYLYVEFEFSMNFTHCFVVD